MMYGQKNVYVGDEARSKAGILLVKKSIEKGKVANFDDLVATFPLPPQRP